MPKTITSIGASLPLLFLKEGKSFIAFTPALDLSASGSTIAKAKKSFEQTIKLFFEELAERGTLEKRSPRNLSATLETDVILHPCSSIDTS